MQKGIDVELLESLVRQHFGPDFTCRLTWNVLRNRYVASDEPRRVARPQTLLGVRIGWKTVGQFSDNLGFRLEVWSADDLPRARALAEAYNGKIEAPKLDVHLCRMAWPASSQPRAA